MITVVTRWEDTQMPQEVEFQMWRQLRGSFGIDRLIFVPTHHKMEGYSFEQYDSIEEALETCKGERVFLEPTGYKSVTKIPHGDIVLIIGNTNLDNMKHAQVNETYRIDTPAGPTKAHLFGSNAAAIALAIRWGQ